MILGARGLSARGIFLDRDRIGTDLRLGRCGLAACRDGAGRRAAVGSLFASISALVDDLAEKIIRRQQVAFSRWRATRPLLLLDVTRAELARTFSIGVFSKIFTPNSSATRFKPQANFAG